jgi:hypothetical protein
MQYREAFLVGLAAMVLGSSALYACGSSGRAASAPSQGEVATSAVELGDDRSRCDFKGRTDRDVVETASPNSVKPNIRRVYGISGQGEDARRVLLCREVDTNLDGVKDVVRTYTDQGDPLHELVDSDFDGKVDTWITFAGGRLAEVKIDRNRDGQPDEKRVYIAGRKVRAELDDNHNGKPNIREIYEDGHLQRRGVDLDGDGNIDRWDRDEVAARLADEKEREEAEKEEQKKQAEQADAGPADAATDARVSVRNR